MDFFYFTLYFFARTQRTLCLVPTGLGPDLQNVLRQSYDYLTIMPKVRSTYEGRLIYKTSYEGRKAFLRYDSSMSIRYDSLAKL